MKRALNRSNISVFVCLFFVLFLFLFFLFFLKMCVVENHLVLDFVQIINFNNLLTSKYLVVPQQASSNLPMLACRVQYSLSWQVSLAKAKDFSALWQFWFQENIPKASPQM